MSIFDSLFQDPSARRRHNRASLPRQRGEFLQYLKSRGRKDIQLRNMASHLLQINRTLKLTRLRPVAVPELEAAGRKWSKYTGPKRRRLPGKRTYELYTRIARGWLKHLGCLRLSSGPEPYFEGRLREFADVLGSDLGLSRATVATRVWHASVFLKWLSGQNVHLCNSSIQHIERYFIAVKKRGWQQSTLATASHSLKVFFRFAERRSWCRKGIALGIIRIRRPRPMSVSAGLSWKDVCRLLRDLRGNGAMTLRDRAMILLFAVYGLRFSEVQGLLLSDIDFKARTITVRRAKREGVQRFPLRTDVAAALDGYIRDGRPLCRCRNLFVTFVTPYRAPTHSAIWLRTSQRLLESGIVVTNRGPHAFRRACASRLLRRGSTLREISEFLGHRNLGSIGRYAHYKLSDLLKVAEFNLKGLV